METNNENETFRMSRILGTTSCRRSNRRHAQHKIAHSNAMRSASRSLGDTARRNLRRPDGQSVFRSGGITRSKKTLQINKLEHVLIRKVDQLFWNMLRRRYSLNDEIGLQRTGGFDRLQDCDNAGGAQTDLVEPGNSVRKLAPCTIAMWPPCLDTSIAAVA